MVNNNNNLKTIIENKKPFELVQEIQNQIPSFEEFIQNYEVDKKINESYENEIASYGDIRISKGYGPTYYPSLHILEEYPKLHLDSTFRIIYRLDEGYYKKNRKFFKFGKGEYSTEWVISGDLSELIKQQDRIEEGRIEIVKADSDKRDKNLEEEVKRQLRKDIRKFELAARDGKREPSYTSGEFRNENAYCSDVGYWSLDTTCSKK